MLHIIPSHRGRPADDAIFALNAEANERKARGESIINSTVGILLGDDGKLAILPTAARIVGEVPPEEWAPYAPIAGSHEFRQAVIRDLFASEPDLLSSAAAAATPGGSGALRCAITNYLEPGQSLLTTNFFWAPYQALCDEADRKVATFSMFDKALAFDVASFDRALAGLISTQGRALVVLNDPCHNPTGFSMSAADWKAVVERLLARGAEAPVTLLVDMAYAAYGPGDSRAFLAHLRPLLGKVGLTFAWSASKTFTHYGLRVGAIVACEPDAAQRAETEAAFGYTCRGTWSNCTRGGMRAITRLLSEPELASACDRERAELKNLIDARVRAFNAAARDRNLSYPRYDGGFFVTVFVDDAFERAARMREKGVFVIPGKGSLRVALCSVAEKDVPRLVDALATSS